MNRNIQYLPTEKGYKHHGPNSQRQTTLPQKSTYPYHLSTPAPHKPPGRSPQWNLPAYLHPSKLHPYCLHSSIMTDNNLFRAFMYVVKNSSPLRTSTPKYKVHSRIINNLLYDYEYHKIYRTRQENEPLLDNNNHNQITIWDQ